jgi:hypothetical protein
MPNPKDQHAHRTDQPKQRIHKINPNRILHPLNPTIPLRIRMDIHLPKDSKQRDPQDKQDRVCDPCEWDAACEGD